MNKFFYPKLAINNIKKNSKTYLPYILTCICTIMMFYNMCYLVVAKDIGSVSDSGSVRYILFLGAIVVGIFSLIFLFYTNNFLIKQRKKEFGLSNILGMEKKHIAKIMFFETLFISILCIATGVLGGILLSKLIILMLFKIISFEATFGFEIPIIAVLITLGLFGVIFTLILIYNIFQVHLSKPIELLKGGNVGEKEPKTKWLAFMIGVITLGVGYYIALTTETPLAALSLFFVAVLLVIIGTYCLFTAGSIAVLKMLRNNKKYYYKSNHFISVSGMIYRMKQNAAGLSNICILSTAVILMISTTISMYAGMEDVLRTRYSRNIIVNGYNVTDEQAEKLDSIINGSIENVGVIQNNVVRYRRMNFSVFQDGADFNNTQINSSSYRNASLVTFITVDDYNEMEDRSIKLSEGEALLYIVRGDIPENILNFNGFNLSIKERINSLYIDGRNSADLNGSGYYYIVVDDIDTINEVYISLTDSDDMGGLSYYYGFDLEADKDTQINLISSLHNTIKDIGIEYNVEGAEASRASFLSLYGGLFFLGIFLGLLFLMATVLIIYYKQIAEGYDDKERFNIMQKVGMGKEEIKKSIHSQVLSVFFLPLLMAVIHIMVAFKVVTRLLLIFNFTNVPLFALCTAITILIFAIFYAIVYTLTARTYYKIVR